MSLVAFLLGLSIWADYDQKFKKMDEQLFDLEIKDTYKEFYMDRFMRVD